MKIDALINHKTIATVLFFISFNSFGINYLALKEINANNKSTKNPVGLVIRKEKSFRGSSHFYCNGTIINKTYLLTAAHCILPHKYSHPTSLENIKAYFKNPSDKNSTKIEFESIEVYALNDKEDWAILKLKDKTAYKTFGTIESNGSEGSKTPSSLTTQFIVKNIDLNFNITSLNLNQQPNPNSITITPATTGLNLNNAIMSLLNKNNKNLNSMILNESSKYDLMVGAPILKNNMLVGIVGGKNVMTKKSVEVITSENHHEQRLEKLKKEPYQFIKTNRALGIIIQKYKPQEHSLIAAHH